MKGYVRAAALGATVITLSASLVADVQADETKATTPSAGVANSANPKLISKVAVAPASTSDVEASTAPSDAAKPKGKVTVVSTDQAQPKASGALPAIVEQEPASEQEAATAPTKVAAVAKPAPQPVAPSLVASIDLSSQRMTVKVNGAVKHVFKISSGRSGYLTPTGTYRPQWMSRMHYSRKYDNAPMPHSVFFHRGYAIHATYATSRLGRPASHGCIRLSPSNAKKFYRLVQRHSKARTKISLYGTAPASRRVYAKARPRYKKYRYANNNGAWNTRNFWETSPPKRRVRTRVKPRRVAKRRVAKKTTYYVPKKTHYAWPGD